MATWLIVYIAMSFSASAFVFGVGLLRSSRRTVPVPMPLAPAQGAVEPPYRSVA